MSTIFISYSRTDKQFVRQLHDALVADQYDVWVDWEDIPLSSEWLAEIYAGIEQADTFISILAPEYLVSENCNKEVDHAVSHNKRLIPIIHRDVIVSQVREPLAKLNWIFFRASDSFDAKYKELNDTIKLDLDWVRQHTRLLVRAIEWNNKKSDDSFLLRGTDLQEAHTWLTQATPDKSPQPTALQKEYLAASDALKIREEQLEQARQRRLAEAEAQRKATQTRARRIIATIAGIFSLLFAIGILYLFPAQTNWQPMPTFNEYRRSLPLVITVSASDPDLIYASNQTMGGLYRSSNGGKSWTSISNKELASVPVYAIAASQNTVYATTSENVFISADRGASWTAAHLSIGKCFDQAPCPVSINPHVAAQAYVAASDKNLWMTNNQGQTWTPIASTEMSDAPITALTTDGAYLVAATNRMLWFRRPGMPNWQALDSSPEITTTISGLAMVGQKGRFLMALGAGGIGDADVTNNKWYPFGYALSDAFIYTVSAAGEQFYASSRSELYCKRFWTVLENNWWWNLGGATPCPKANPSPTLQ